VARKIISRAEALKQGLTTYYLGPDKLCPRGHDAPRYVNGKCVECNRERNKLRPKRTGRSAKTGKTAKSKAVSKAAPATAGAVGAAVVPVVAVAAEPIKDWRYYIREIEAAWQSAVRSIIATGALLIEAKAKVDPGDWLKVAEELPFGERTAQRLMEIARHPILSNPTHGSHLPPSWRTLYELSKIDDQVLLARIEDHTINPETQRKDIKAIAASVTGAVRRDTNKKRREAPPSLAELVERWQNSLATMAGDTIALPANWDRVFGNWREFDKPSDLITLAEQAADTWAKIVEIMRRKAEAA
jgi:hypothetical protein